MSILTLWLLRQLNNNYQPSELRGNEPDPNWVHIDMCIVSTWVSRPLGNCYTLHWSTHTQTALMMWDHVVNIGSCTSSTVYGLVCGLHHSGWYILSSTPLNNCWIWSVIWQGLFTIMYVNAHVYMNSIKISNNHSCVMVYVCMNSIMVSNITLCVKVCYS